MIYVIMMDVLLFIGITMSKYNITNPHYGYYHPEDISDLKPCKASFDTSMSKNMGDGKWCKTYLKDNFYSWIDYKGKYGNNYVYGICKRCLDKKDFQK